MDNLWIHQEEVDRYIVKARSDSVLYITDSFWDAVEMVWAIEKFLKSLKGRMSKV